jgi:hypothetical protein
VSYPRKERFRVHEHKAEKQNDRKQLNSDIQPHKAPGYQNLKTKSPRSTFVKGRWVTPETERQQQTRSKFLIDQIDDYGNPN